MIKKFKLWLRNWICGEEETTVIVERQFEEPKEIRTGYPTLDTSEWDQVRVQGMSESMVHPYGDGKYDLTEAENAEEYYLEEGSDHSDPYTLSAEVLSEVKEFLMSKLDGKSVPQAFGEPKYSLSKGEMNELVTSVVNIIVGDANKHFMGE